MLYRISSFAIILSSFFIFQRCNKTGPAICNFSPENSMVECMPDDTSNDVNGFKTLLYGNGVTKMAEGNFENGKRVGFWKYYHPNGELSLEGNYTNSKADGYWKVYYETGNIQSEGTYNNCERTGYWKYFYDEANYSVHFEGNYKNDNKTGNWKEFNAGGSVIKEYNCE